MKEKLAALVELLDWITQAEEALGREQPQKEASQPLETQRDEHKVGPQALLAYV